MSSPIARGYFSGDGSKLDFGQRVVVGFDPRRSFGTHNIRFFCNLLILVDVKLDTFDFEFSDGRCPPNDWLRRLERRVLKHFFCKDLLLQTDGLSYLNLTVMVKLEIDSIALALLLLVSAHRRA